MLHPKSFVLFDVAKRLYAKVGLARARHQFRSLRNRRSRKIGDFSCLSRYRREVWNAGRLFVQNVEFPRLEWRWRFLERSRNIFLLAIKSTSASEPSQLVHARVDESALGRGDFGWHCRARPRKLSLWAHADAVTKGGGFHDFREPQRPLPALPQLMRERGAAALCGELVLVAQLAGARNLDEAPNLPPLLRSGGG